MGFEKEDKLALALFAIIILLGILKMIIL